MEFLTNPSNRSKRFLGGCLIFFSSKASHLKTMQWAENSKFLSILLVFNNNIATFRDLIDL